MFWRKICQLHDILNSNKFFFFNQKELKQEFLISRRKTTKAKLHLLLPPNHVTPKKKKL